MARTMITLINWIFVICLLMGLILIGIMFSDSVPNAAGVAHPDHAGMQAGGDGAARLAHIGTLAFLFQSLLLLLIVCLSILGVAERYRSREFYACMAASFVFMLLVWWQTYSGHQAFLESGETGYFMGFPVATAWQVYGTWLGAIPLILVYSLGFRKFIYTAEDEAEFNKLLAQSESSRQAVETSP